VAIDFYLNRWQLCNFDERWNPQKLEETLLLLLLGRDILAILIARAKADGQVGGLVPHLVEGGLSILQYADDTIMFMEHDFAKAVNMKLILAFFELLSSLKINFHKSEIFCFDKAKEEENSYKTIFGCEVGVFTIQIFRHTYSLYDAIK
jgi:hypothetical protein